jgi:hypothetical protein
VLSFSRFFAIALLISAATLLASGASVVVGKGILEIPAPEGCVSIAESDAEFEAARKMAASSGMKLLALFHPQDAKTGAPRNFTVQVDPATEHTEFRLADFETGRGRFETERQQTADECKKAMGAKEYALESIHDQGERHYSCVTRIIAADGGQFCGISTTAILQERILYLNAFVQSVSPEDVEQLKLTTKKWIAAVVSANPSNTGTLQNENQPIGKNVWLGFGKAATLFLVLWAVWMKFGKKQHPV